MLQFITESQTTIAALTADRDHYAKLMRSMQNHGAPQSAINQVRPHLEAAQARLDSEIAHVEEILSEYGLSIA